MLSRRRERRTVDVNCGQGEGDGFLKVHLSNMGSGEVFAMDDVAFAEMRAVVVMSKIRRSRQSRIGM